MAHQVFPPNYGQQFFLGQVCPYLGIYSDVQVRFAAPDDANCCHVPSPPLPVAIAYQFDICMGDRWADCPLYMGSRDNASSPVSLPWLETGDEGNEVRFSGWAITGVALLAVIVVATLWWLLHPAFLEPGVSAVASSVGQVQRLASLSPVSPPSTVASAGYFSVTVPSPTPVLWTATPLPPTASWTRRPTATDMPALASPTPSPSVSPTVRPAASVFTDTGVGAWTIAHIVQPAETLASIALRYQSSAKEIVAANSLERDDLIYPGQVLTIPLTVSEVALTASPVLTGAKIDPTRPLTLPSPILLEPEPAATISGVVTLRWRWETPLTPGQSFVVHLWRADRPAPCRLIFTTEPVYRLHLQGYPPGVYRWMVRVAEGYYWKSVPILERFLTASAERAWFTWTGP